ncbi:hypothetical protein [Aeromicrobium sp.]|uniref:hypothetical protein n=1 Tax=Aeromicrobium sp. TaxID=1871063 RepID=UPI003C53F71C
MFVGHYGVSFAARSTSVSVPLWVWFVAVQWLDLVFMTLALAGVEKVRITAGFTESNDLDLYYMPYSHGLVGALILSVVFAGIVAAVFPAARRPLGFGLVAFAVFSHWLLDLVMHTPDMPLLDDSSTKVGLGLWNHVAIAFPLELLVLGLGMLIYARSVELVERSGRLILLAFFVLMALLQVYGTFSPSPESSAAFAGSALAGYVLLAALAAWVERRVVVAHAR